LESSFDNTCAQSSNVYSEVLHLTGRNESSTIPFALPSAFLADWKMQKTSEASKITAEQQVNGRSLLHVLVLQGANNTTERPAEL
jgi:hypothetical protein